VKRLLNLLSEVQSELVQAARDSGWDVNYEELTHLSQQAVISHRNRKPDAAIRFRAKAIDLLMRQLYVRSRGSE